MFNEFDGSFFSFLKKMRRMDTYIKKQFYPYKILIFTAPFEMYANISNTVHSNKQCSWYMMSIIVRALILYAHLTFFFNYFLS